MKNKPQQFDKPHLPKWIDPKQLAHKGETLEGTILLAKMSRLLEMLYEKTGVAVFHLHFGKNQAGFYVISGEVAAELQLLCQRCNQPMNYRATSKVHLSPIVHEKQAKALPKNLEPIVIQDESIELLALIEDELLLALPMVAMHDNEKCHPESFESD